MGRMTAAKVSAAVVCTAAVGSMASREAGGAWYRRLDKPAFQPPPAAFPVAWTTLYAVLALAATRTLDRMDEDASPAPARGYRRALAANLVLNASWSWVFFRAHRLTAATAVAGLLTVSGADLVRRTLPVSRSAGVALTAYPLWCGFATVLSAAIRRRNPAGRG